MKRNTVIFLTILFIGLFLRLVGNNWDAGWHLHPDERFLTMVGVDVKIPSSLGQYLNPEASSFNPVNKDYPFYVYGTFPILLNKIIARYLFNDTYGQFNLQGRMLSGIADFFIIVIVFKLVELVEKKLKLNASIKYGAAFLYAIAVLPIQLSHFFTVDTFLSVFAWSSFYFAAKVVVKKEKEILLNCIFSGLSLGLSFASKISALYIAPLIGVSILWGVFKVKGGFIKKITLLLVFGISAYCALRLGSPYYFATGNILNPSPSLVFMNNINILKSFENPAQLYPPAVQWLSKSVFFPIINIIFFGVGPLYFLCAVLGVLLLLKKKNSLVALHIVWVFGFIILQSIQFAKTMRYFIFIYPSVAIFAAVGLHAVFAKVRHFARPLFFSCIFLVGIGILFWPLAFMSIYTKDHSRITASYWIYDNIPSRSVISYEYWDDPLPLTVEDPAIRNYVGQEVHIFDADSDEKWKTIDAQLKQLDYYIMSSNRGWGSIMAVPSRYPITSRFYSDMFQGKRGFTLVKEFSSYPSLRYLGIPVDFPDQWAEEAFTVYDHPLVKIFKKQ